MGIRNTSTSGCTAALILGLTSVSFAAELPTAPDRYDLETIDADGLEAAAEAGVPFTLRALGRDLHVLLEPSSLRSSRFRMVQGNLYGQRLAFAKRPRTFKGVVLGEKNSTVRLSTGRFGARGCIKTAAGWTFIEPEKDAALRAAKLHRVYTENELDAHFHGTCAATLTGTAHFGHDADEHTLEELSAKATTSAEPAQLRELEIAIDADFEYFQTHGGDAQAEMESVMNVVDGIYESELGLTISLVSINIWDDAADPYTHTNADNLLIEMRNYWNANRRNVSRDVVHLFTGKNLDGTVVGLAYLSVICSGTSGYGLSQDLNSEALMPILVAHEIGHNLGANHDSSGSSPHYVMYPSLGLSNLDEFSATSQADISRFVDRISCLAPATTDDGDDPADGGSGGSGDDGTAGDGGNGSDGTAGDGGGGGGGGGPVDPLFVLLAASALAIRRMVSR